MHVSRCHSVHVHECTIMHTGMRLIKPVKVLLHSQNFWWCLSASVHANYANSYSDQIWSHPNPVPANGQNIIAILVNQYQVVPLMLYMYKHLDQCNEAILPQKEEKIQPGDSISMWYGHNVGHCAISQIEMAGTHGKDG